LDKKGFTPHLVKPISSPSSLLEAGRAERVCRGAPSYLPHTFDKVRSLPQRKSRVLIRGAGFTLIEVLAGLIILAIGLLAIAAMQITSTKGSYFSSNVTQATIFAQDKLEYFKNISYGDSNLSNGQHNEGTIPGTIFSRQYNVVEDAGNSMKTITVTVQWTDRGDHSISFSTIRSK
jgi:prepilin-type N-terminal cleavage/methylation domain-containing protein